MRILGIDPGIESTGYGLIETDGTRHSAILYGAIRSGRRKYFPDRLRDIHAGLTAILDREEVHVVAVEGIFHAVNVRSALKLGHARGVALLAAAQAHLPVFEYSPLQIKQAIVGYGRAEKSQVQTMVRLLLSLPEIPRPDDAADALAVAICHGHRASSLTGAASAG